MSNFFKSSIGKKFLMSITGSFLMIFLCVHLGANLLLLFGEDAFNAVSHFMESNPLIQVMQPVLALGFIFHIIYSLILTIQNMKARGPEKYSEFNQKNSSTIASRNMLVLGGLIFVFLVLHISHFFVPIKFIGIENTIVAGNADLTTPYDLVVAHFEHWFYSIIYVIGAIFLGFHLQHAFWSAFQTLGLSNTIWRKRLTVIGNIYSFAIAFGFAFIPLFFLIKHYL